MRIKKDDVQVPARRPLRIDDMLNVIEEQVLLESIQDEEYRVKALSILLSMLAFGALVS